MIELQKSNGYGKNWDFSLNGPPCRGDLSV